MIVGTCLDIAGTSGRECRGQVGLPRLFCEWHQILAIHTILTHGLTQPTQRRLNLVGEAEKFWHCGKDTLWSASAPAPNFVWPLWSHSLCAGGASPPQDCSSFPIPCKFHLYESTCCETIFRLLRARCSESHEPFEHRFGDGAVCWALLHKFLTKLLAWFVNLLCWQQQPAF